jgi:shikimate kinase / 3-dehydroquinate synthase
MADPNIILTGFMGTGKSSVGREVADRLGRPFVDLDDMIVKQAGKPIPEIFATDGEAAFRALEDQMCQELKEPSGQVIATGGGAVLNPANREALEAGGTVVCLEASPDVIARRLARGDGRPMLSGFSPGARIAELLAERASAYAVLPHHLDTSALSIAQAAERVMGMASGLAEGGHRVPVGRRTAIAAAYQPNRRRAVGDWVDTKPYDILIAEGLLDRAGERLIGAGLDPGRCAVISNPTVQELWWERLRISLADAGFEARLYTVPDGERHKVLDTAALLYSRLADHRMARDETIIALGGGVVGDMAGFVAATWLRGVPFVQIPTSLLAMVDASIGGKVALDLPQGKNLVGAFKAPELVIVDPLVLRTLPGVEFRCGLAEVAKAAVIGDAALFEELAGAGPATLTGMIADAVRVKVGIVERDPFERGERAVLNLGHTFGHALELTSGFSLRHGEAVGLGMIAAARLSATLGRCEHTLPARVRRVVERLGLPVEAAFDPADATAAMGTDKKRRSGALRFALPSRVGRVEIVTDVPAGAITAAWEAIRRR